MRGESFQFLTRCNFSINTPLPSLKKTSPFAATPVPTLELLPATYVQTSFPVLLFNAESVPPKSMSTPPVSVAALDVIALLATSLGLATAYHCLNCLGPSLFSDRHASLSRASWPFFQLFLHSSHLLPFWLSILQFLPPLTRRACRFVQLSFISLELSHTLYFLVNHKLQEIAIET